MLIAFWPHWGHLVCILKSLCCPQNLHCNLSFLACSSSYPAFSHLALEVLALQGGLDTGVVSLFASCQGWHGDRYFLGPKSPCSLAKTPGDFFPLFSAFVLCHLTLDFCSDAELPRTCYFISFSPIWLFISCKFFTDQKNTSKKIPPQNKKQTSGT